MLARAELPEFGVMVEGDEPRSFLAAWTKNVCLVFELFRKYDNSFLMFCGFVLVSNFLESIQKQQIKILLEYSQNEDEQNQFLVVMDDVYRLLSAIQESPNLDDKHVEGTKIKFFKMCSTCQFFST